MIDDLLAMIPNIKLVMLGKESVTYTMPQGYFLHVYELHDRGNWCVEYVKSSVPMHLTYGHIGPDAYDLKIAFALGGTFYARQ